MVLLLLCLMLIGSCVSNSIHFLYTFHPHVGSEVCFKWWHIFEKASHSGRKSDVTLNRFPLLFPLCFAHLSLPLASAMSVNSSSSNASIPTPRPIFLHDFDIVTCFYLTSGSVNTILNIVVNIFLLPLFTFVLYVGIRRQRRTMSHTDVLTVQIIVAEVTGVFGAITTYFGSVTGTKALMLTGIYWCIAYQFIIVSFHMLTCVEKYLAVVHPITYVGLRKEKGIRMRNACICCAWLLAFVEAGITILLKRSLPIHSIAIVSLNIAVVSFCNLSVLRVLCQPRPGTEGERRQVDAFKLKAFYTIFVVLAALLFRYGFNFFSTIILFYSAVDEHISCVLWMSCFWFSLPSQLVAPLLFLHREGKLCCQNRRTRQ